jgi:hypothetical protein
MNTLLTNYKFLISLVVVFVCLFTAQANAQHFEGVMVLETTDNDKKTDEVILFVKKDRIKFSGKLPGSNDLGPLTGESLLLRADERDLIIFGKDKSAVQIKLQELETLLNMFSQGNTPSPTPVEVQPTVTMEYTGEKKRIHGYSAAKMVIKDAEKPNVETHIWTTEDIHIDWMNMINAFGSLTKQTGLDDVVNNYGWDLTKTPLLIEVYNRGELRNKMEFTKIESRRLSNNEIDIPSDYKLMTFFQMMMQQGQQR